jgi:predicted protein tyrosine phosphatase
MMNVLFVCSANRLRSPTAEQVFSIWPGGETDSAGISSGARVAILGTGRLGRRDFRHGEDASQQADPSVSLSFEGQAVICLDIPDDYEFMDPVLVQMLEKRVGRFLPQAGPTFR